MVSASAAVASTVKLSTVWIIRFAQTDRQTCLNSDIMMKIDRWLLLLQERIKTRPLLFCFLQLFARYGWMMMSETAGVFFLLTLLFF